MPTDLLPLPDSVETLTVQAWPDPVIDVLGQHPCSTYVETFYLGILGPSTTWLLRHLATTLEAAPDGFRLDLAETARRLGLGERPGRNSPFLRTLGRLVRFGLARLDGDDDDRGGDGDGDGDGVWTFAVRTRVPPLTRPQVARLPELLQLAHARWHDEQLRTPAFEQQRRRARQLGLSYLEAGLGSEETEHQLVRLGYHPALCSDATRWALDRHSVALALAGVH